MDYMYIPTGIKGLLVIFGVDCHWKGKIVGIVGGGKVYIHPIFSFTHIKGNTLGTGEEVEEVTSGMGVDRIGEIGDRPSEGQAARMYEKGFTAVL